MAGMVVAMTTDDASTKLADLVLAALLAKGAALSPDRMPASEVAAVAGDGLAGRPVSPSGKTERLSGEACRALIGDLESMTYRQRIEDRETCLLAAGEIRRLAAENRAMRSALAEIRATLYHLDRAAEL